MGQYNGDITRGSVRAVAVETLAGAEATHHLNFIIRLPARHLGNPTACFALIVEVTVRITADDLEQLQRVSASSEPDTESCCNSGAASERFCRGQMDVGLFTKHVEGSDDDCYRDRKNAQHDAFSYW